MGLNLTDKEIEAIENGTFGEPPADPWHTIPHTQDKFVETDDENDQISRMEHFFNVVVWTFSIAACLFFWWVIFG